MTDSFSIEPKSNLNTTIGAISIKTLTSDKIVFIKNQLKTETPNFSGYFIGDEGAKMISEILLNSQFSHSPSKRNFVNKIKELKLNKSGISDEGFASLAKCLEKVTSVTTLNLSRNKLKDDSYTNILNLVKNNKNLKYINLTSNNFSDSVKDKIINNSRNLNSNIKIDI